jgi:HSP20 family protein
MSLMRWKPQNELETLRAQLDRLFDQMMGGFFQGLPALDPTRAFVPNFEVYTTDHELVVSAELPGMDPQDVEVEVTPEAVHVVGERKKETEIKEDNYYRTERHYGRFERVVPLPYRVKDAEAKASYKHGVLSIRLPFAEEVKPPKSRKLLVEAE